MHALRGTCAQAHIPGGSVRLRQHGSPHALPRPRCTWSSRLALVHTTTSPPARARRWPRPPCSSAAPARPPARERARARAGRASAPGAKQHRKHTAPTASAAATQRGARRTPGAILSQQLINMARQAASPLQRIMLGCFAPLGPLCCSCRRSLHKLLGRVRHGPSFFFVSRLASKRRRPSRDAHTARLLPGAGARGGTRACREHHARNARRAGAPRRSPACRRRVPARVAAELLGLGGGRGRRARRARPA